jgi:hypothetical protein
MLTHTNLGQLIGTIGAIAGSVAVESKAARLKAISDNDKRRNNQKHKRYRPKQAKHGIRAIPLDSDRRGFFRRACGWFGLLRGLVRVASAEFSASA